MKFDCAHDELVDVSKLLMLQNPKNNNKHSKEQIDRLAKIIDFQGQRSPIVISKRSGFITKGHGRLFAIDKLGWEKAAVNYQDYLSEAQEYADMTADNEIARWAEFDEEKFLEDIKTIDLGDFELLGLQELPDILEPEKEGLTDPDNVPDVAQNIHNVQLGQIWKLGNHRLMCGDSTDKETVEKLMSGERADMVFTDPPYNQETEGGFKSEIGPALLKQNAEIEHLCNFNPEMFLKILPTVFDKNKLNTYCFCNKDLVVDYLKWSRENGYAYNILIWKKPTAIPIGGSYRPDVEYLLVFRKSGIFNGARNDVNYSKVLEHNREINKVHPTMKPVEMIENQLKIASNEWSIVADLFGGSGSTLIACEKTNRKCFMMELDPHYCSVIIERWQNFTGQKAELING